MEDKCVPVVERLQRCATTERSYRGTRKSINRFVPVSDNGSMGRLDYTKILTIIGCPICKKYGETLLLVVCLQYVDNLIRSKQAQSVDARIEDLSEA